MRRSLILFLCATLWASLAVAQPSPATSGNEGSPKAREFLVRQPSFTDCELQAFITLTAGRNAIVFGETQESLLGAKGNDAFQISVINELFTRMKSDGFRDYPLLAAEKFYQCVEWASIPVKKDLNGAAVCLARQDISYYLYARKLDGRTQAEATAIVKKMFASSSKAIYPEALIDQTAPMVFRMTSADDFYELRRLSFETCLFPEEWKAWWSSQRAASR